MEEFKKFFGDLFSLHGDSASMAEIVDRIKAGGVLKGTNMCILVLAIFIASIGLNMNSTAVIIGAMLISPLMGPIIGMGLAVGTNDLDLLKRAAKNFGVATLISVLTATLYFLITPLSEAQSELLARTSPTLYDVLIAFCGGAAGIIALCTRGKGNVIPGVAIATALMPPLCTAGFGLATGHFLYFLGAFYLFFINTVFIALATYMGVRLMHFHQYEFLSPEGAKKAHRYLMSIVILTMLPAVYLTVNIVRQHIFDNNVRNFIKTEVAQRGTQIISNSVERDSLKLRIVAVGREISEERRTTAEQHMEQYGMAGFRLRIIQGTQSDSLLMLNSQLNHLNVNHESDRQKLMELSAENATLSQQLSKYTRLEQLASAIRPEMATLFPLVSHFSLSRVTDVSRDSTGTCSYVAAIIKEENGKPLTPTEFGKLHDWLKTRIKADSLLIVRQHN